MDSLLTSSNIVFAIGIIGTIFGIYKMFHDPQVALDKQQDLNKQEVESKASILEERAKWDREQYDKRFSDMSKRLDDAFTLAQNHTHSVDVKVDSLIISVNAMNLQMTNAITKMDTTIAERLPNFKK